MIIFKHKKDKALFCSLHPILIMIFADAYVYMQENHQKNITVTQTISTFEEDKKLKRVSASHREGRAIDIRSSDLTLEQINDLVSYLNNKWAYEKYRYMSKSGIYRLAYHHNNGNGDHIHLAIHAKYARKLDSDILVGAISN